jgi:hypothetical protein
LIVILFVTFTPFHDATNRTVELTVYRFQRCLPAPVLMISKKLLDLAPYD